MARENIWNRYIEFDQADSMGGTCANISMKSIEQIKELRDWCDHLLKLRTKPITPHP